jgi:hypothetical protein
MVAPLLAVLCGTRFLGVHLPNLLEISYHGGPLVQSKPFGTISTWRMQRLRSLRFANGPDTATLPLLDFFKLLQTHGPYLQYLKLTSPYLREQDISNLLVLCTDLRSLNVDSGVSLFTLSASHERLEKIRVDPGLQLDVRPYHRMDITVDAVKNLKLKARTSFPRLIEAKVIVNDGFVHNATLSFRTGDTFLTLRHRSKIYRVFDGQTDFVGAYFGQAVDCTDFVAIGYLFIPLEVPS